VLSAAATFSVITVFGNEKTNTNSGANLANTLTPGEKISLPQNPNWQNDFDTISSNYTTNTQSQAEQTPEEQTTTDAVATSLLSNYLVLKQNGLLNQSSAQKLVDQSLNAIENSGSSRITEDNLNVISDNGNQTVAEYGEDLGLILKSYKSEGGRNEILILREVMERADPQKITQLEEVAEVYRNIAHELKVMRVPKIFVKAHLDTVNGMLGLVAGLEKMEKVFEDPLISLHGIQQYQNGGDLFVQATRASSEFIKQNGIEYKQGSGGYYLLYGI